MKYCITTLIFLSHSICPMYNNTLYINNKNVENVDIEFDYYDNNKTPLITRKGLIPPQQITSLSLNNRYSTRIPDHLKHEHRKIYLFIRHCPEVVELNTSSESLFAHNNTINLQKITQNNKTIAIEISHPASQTKCFIKYNSDFINHETPLYIGKPKFILNPSLTIYNDNVYSLNIKIMQLNNDIDDLPTFIASAHIPTQSAYQLPVYLQNSSTNIFFLVLYIASNKRAILNIDNDIIKENDKLSFSYIPNSHKVIIINQLEQIIGEIHLLKTVLCG